MRDAMGRTAETASALNEPVLAVGVKACAAPNIAAMQSAFVQPHGLPGAL